MLHNFKNFFQFDIDTRAKPARTVLFVSSTEIIVITDSHFYRHHTTKYFPTETIVVYFRIYWRKN